MQDVVQQLGDAYTFRALHVTRNISVSHLLQEALHPYADLYLLDGHHSTALQIARNLEEQGACLVNSWAATQTCQDLFLVAERMAAASLPWPRTWNVPSFRRDLSEERIASLPFPLLVRARYASSGDRVEKVASSYALQHMLASWSDLPAVLQEHILDSSLMVKVWVFGQETFAARRSSSSSARTQERFEWLAQIDEDIKRIALEVGRIFGLLTYDVDFLLAERKPTPIGIHTFPTFAGLDAQKQAAVSFIECLLRAVSGTSATMPAQGIVRKE